MEGTAKRIGKMRTGVWEQSRIWKWLVLCALLLCGIYGTAYGGEQRVFDDAGLFSEEEAEELEQQVSQVRQETGMDMVIVTTAQTGEKSAESFADDYYDAGGFGTGEDANGALFLVDMAHREIYLSTSGAMIRYLTDERVEKILDDAYGYAGDSDFAGAAGAVLEDIGTFYKKGIPGGQYNYDRETGKISRYRSIRWYEALLALAVAGACGGIAVRHVKKEYAMEDERRASAGFRMAYRANSAFAYRTQNDVMVNSFVTQQLIPRAVSSSGRGGASSSRGRSTTHRSSSGRSHGGGGRRF